jgi:hypothetical protein
VEPIGVVFLVILVAAIVAIALAARAAQERRRQALARWARGRGWDYQPDQVSSLERRFPDFSAFRQGSDRYGYNIMRGEAGPYGAWAFDYHYETYSTDSKGHRTTHHHHFSAVVLDTGLLLKPLTIRAEGFLDRVKGVFGFDDIDFESADFSRSFWVASPDRRWAYDVVHQETMERLLDAPRFSIELGGTQAVALRGTRFDPPAFEHALDLLCGILDRIPPDVRERLEIRE